LTKKFDINAGDYIGCHIVSGAVEADMSGEAGVREAARDRVPCTNYLFDSCYSIGWSKEEGSLLRKVMNLTQRQGSG
jgi:hypothetical protein